MMILENEVKIAIKEVFITAYPINCSKTNIAGVCWNLLQKAGKKLFQTSYYLAVAYQAFHALLEGYC